MVNRSFKDGMASASEGLPDSLAGYEPPGVDKVGWAVKLMESP